MGQPQGKYLKTQFDDLIQLLSLSARTLLLEMGQLSHPQVRIPLVQR